MTELEVAMRDGTILRADVHVPAGEGPWPVLVVRTPYGKRNAGVLERLDVQGAVGRGYLVIVQDCRGRFASDGVWEPLLHEAADGFDTIAWAANLPKSNGRVGTYGPSYLGHTQRAAQAARPPGLLASAPSFTWMNPHDGLIRRGGAYELGLVTQWTLNNGFDVLARRYAEAPDTLIVQLAALNAALDDFATRVVWELPADDLPTLRALGLSIPKPNGPLIQHSDIPSLTTAGWFDCFLQGSLDAAPTAVIIGPWTHDGPTAVDGRPPTELEFDFLDRFLQPERDHGEPEASALVFVMGADEWRRFPAWPPPNTETAWYLHPDGGLAPDVPPDCPPDTFDHDADDPVPTLGGALLIGPDYPAGPQDQAVAETRDDVLVYTSEPLVSALEVVGRVRMHLVAESSAAGTDWVARLCDVGPDGVSHNITDGILRTDGQVGEHVIDLWSTAHVFRPGHRIRVQIASSCFPRWDRNPAAPRARQTVHHDTARPSRIVLPVLTS